MNTARMTPEAQRIAIAEACNDYEDLKSGHSYKYSHDYLNDLNAMHEAEKVLDANQEAMYYDNLCKVAALDAYKSTASQRAEAFLRALGLWKE